MRTVGFELSSTLVDSMAVRFLGRGLAVRVPVLARLNIPAPVIGGGLVAMRPAASRYFGPAALTGAPAPRRRADGGKSRWTSAP